MFLLSLSLYFVAFTLLAQAFVKLLWPRTTILRQQLLFYEKSWGQAHSGVEQGHVAGTTGMKERLKAVIVRLVSQGRPVTLVQAKLNSAGLAIEWAEFTYYHLLGVCLVGALAYLLGGLIAAIIVIAGLAWSPMFILDFLVYRRRSRFNDQLPETLTMLSSSLKAGYSFLQAVDMVVKESMPPVSEEFKRLLTDTQLGLPLEESLEKMSVRIGSTSFDWMVLAVKIQREVGGNLTEVLATLARTIRERGTVTRQIKVLTAEGRLSALILLCLPVFVTASIYLLNPGYMSLLFTDKAGLTMIFGAFFLMAVGALWLRKIIKIEV